MCKNYNLALIPTTKNNLAIKYAHFLSHIADKYLLGAYSLPHVTLYQFKANDADIESIWKRILNKLGQKSIDLMFDKFSCITFDQTTFWTSLLPNEIDNLKNMHNMVANILKQPIKTNYDPHMTLINTKDASYEKLVNQLANIYQPINDIFILALGRSDDIGQLTEILYIHNQNNYSYSI